MSIDGLNRGKDGGTGMQRYDMILGTKCGEGWQELEPAEEGEWVR